MSFGKFIKRTLIQITFFGILGLIIEFLLYMDLILHNLDENSIDFECEYIKNKSMAIGPEDIVYYNENIMILANYDRIK